jgi:hypothetical protein
MTDDDLIDVLKGKPLQSNWLCNLNIHKWTNWQEPIRPQVQMMATQWRYCKRCNFHQHNSLN